MDNTEGSSTSTTSTRTVLPHDKAEKLTKLLSSAMKQEKVKKTKESNSNSARIKELEARLALCIKEYKKYKDECLELKAEKELCVNEIHSLTHLNIELKETLEMVNDQLLQLEAETGDYINLKFQNEALSMKLAELEDDKTTLEKKLQEASSLKSESLQALNDAEEQMSRQKKQLTQLQKDYEILQKEKLELADIDTRYERVLDDLRKKECELSYLRKVEQNMEILKNETGEAKMDNIKLQEEIIQLRSAVESSENENKLLEQKQIECGRLQIINNELRQEVAEYKESTKILEAVSACLEKKREDYEKLLSERDDLKASLQLLENEEDSFVMSKHMEDKEALSVELGNLRKSFDAYTQDAAATLNDKHEREIAMETEMAQLREKINVGHQELEKMSLELESTKASLQNATEMHKEAVLAFETERRDKENVAVLELEIENLKQTNCDLESIAAEKSLEAMDMRLREERRRNQEETVKQQSMTTPEEINTNGTVKLGCSVSSQNDEVIILKMQHQRELDDMKDKLLETEKKYCELKKIAVAGKPSKNGEDSGTTRRVQLLKSQKEAAEHRAETAEGKLQDIARKLSDVTSSRDALQKEKVLLEKKISRIEKEKKTKTAANSRQDANPSSDSSKHVQVSNAHNESANKSTTTRDIAVTLVVAVAFFCLGTMSKIGRPS